LKWCSKASFLANITMKNRGFPYIFGPAFCTLIASFSVAALSGQTLIDIGKQGKNIDFTGAPYTRPVKTGTSLPATCAVGDMFLNLAGTTGNNLYACTGTNTWTVQAGGQGNSGLPDPGTNGIVVRTGPNATTAVPAPRGTVVGTSDTQTLTNKSIDASEINTGVLSPSQMPALSGDVSTASGGTSAILATVNSTTGTFGGSSSIPVITVNGKGLITGVSTVQIAAGGAGGAGGGSGASTATQLLDFAPTLAGSSVTLGSACAGTSPCLVNLNGIRYSFTSSYNLSVSGNASDTVFFYVDPAGNVTAGYNATNTYTSTTLKLASGTSAFPAGVFPLFQCTVAAGVFSACSDYRPILSETTFAPGAGTTISTSSAGTAVNVAQVIDYIPNLNYTIPGTACGHYEIGTNANSGAWGLPTPSVMGMATNGCTINIKAAGGSITVAPTNATINGQANYVIGAGQYCSVVSDGTNYQVGQCSGTYTAPVRGIGYVFDGNGNNLTPGMTGYFTVPYSCVINSWNVTVDTGTATVDIWKVASGTSIPTAANTITGSAKPSISTGTAVHSTSVTGWTTNVAQNDIFGFHVDAVFGPTILSVVLACQ
jgi:hypothetical protein